MQQNAAKLGQILKAAREAKEMTQAELADKTDIALRTIISLENDQRFPTYEVLYKIIRALGISADHIFWPDKTELKPEQEQVIREFLECSEWEQTVMPKQICGTRLPKINRWCVFDKHIAACLTGN